MLGDAGWSNKDVLNRRRGSWNSGTPFRHSDFSWTLNENTATVPHMIVSTLLVKRREEKKIDTECFTTRLCKSVHPVFNCIAWWDDDFWDDNDVWINNVLGDVWDDNVSG